MSSTFIRDFLGRSPGVSSVGGPGKSLDELQVELIAVALDRVRGERRLQRRQTSTKRRRELDVAGTVPGGRVARHRTTWPRPSRRLERESSTASRRAGNVARLE